MPHKYSTAFSHLVLAGTGIYCLVRYHGGGAYKFPDGSYTIIIVNSILGVWKWGNPDYGDKVEKPYNFTGFLQRIIALPFIVTDIWLGYGYQRELAYLHSLIAVLPFSLYLADKSTTESIDLITAINCTSLGIVAFMQENYYGVAAAVSYLFNHFFIKEISDNLDDELPIVDLYNYGMCFFCYFALRSITGVSPLSSS